MNHGHSMAEVSTVQDKTWIACECGWGHLPFSLLDAAINAYGDHVYRMACEDVEADYWS
jgi:hypothetical protein